MRVPAKHFDAAFAAVRDAGRVLSESRQANDVTEEFVDVGIRGDNARRSRERLPEVLKLAKKVEDRGKGVRIGEWTVEHIQDDYYKVQVWVREEGFRQWFERDFAWQVDLNKGRVMPLSDFAAQLMPRGQGAPQHPGP